MGIFDKLFGGKKASVDTPTDTTAATPIAPEAAATPVTEEVPDTLVAEEESTQVGYADEEKPTA
jgi:hypothetical protein